MLINMFLRYGILWENNYHFHMLKVLIDKCSIVEVIRLKEVVGIPNLNLDKEHWYTIFFVIIP